VHEVREPEIHNHNGLDSNVHRGYGFRPARFQRATGMTRSFQGSEMAKGHKDKVAVITGAAGGIGQAFAKRLAEDGVHIAVADVLDGKDTVKLVQAAGRQALAVNCDVSSEPSVAAMAREVQAKFSHVDIVINCAGIFPQKEFYEMTFADWRQVLAINLDGTFLVTAAFVPGMRARKWGRVVNMASSTLGSVVTGFAHYAASKGGIVGFTRALASDLASDGITVNAISPGLTRSPGTLVRAPRPGFKTMDEEYAAVAQMQAIKLQRRCCLYHRADAERGRRKGAVVAALIASAERTNI
jgi:NAD(P)-dependent dehydrogenase (short-subunit alcohol dehydrogenase family)